MKLYRFDGAVSHLVDLCGYRSLRMSRLVRSDRDTRVDVMYVGAGGLVGAHEAGENQIFAVVKGNGWVCGISGHQIQIDSGTDAFRESGE